MARSGLEVIRKQAEAGRIPDALALGVALVLDLIRRRTMEQIGERIRIRRKGGYCGFDVLLYLLLFFASGQLVGLREFWARIRSCHRELAAVANRDRLASPAALSRALDDVELELFRPESEWLLSEGAGIDVVLRHPSVQTYDARGEGWHVFHFDPTVTTLRHRALPRGEDLPAGRRRSEPLAAPGYTGRKRGDVQVCRGTLQHAGSGAWLQAMLGPGNGDSHAELEGALQAVCRTCLRIEHPLVRALLVMDGQFGWVPFLSTCRRLGVPALTRLTRHQLFEQPDVLARLREGTWHLVPDSRSGPQRSALDLGLVTVPAGEDTRQSDGTKYEPITVRVVVSRYPRTGKAEHGRVLDGWQYEMFIVDVSAEALPAAEAISLYFARAGQENRFAQEDRELGLDRLFSYHLPGQEFAVVVGLWVWNLRLVRGFELEPPPAKCPVQEPSVTRVDLRHLTASSDPEQTTSTTEQGSAPPIETIPAVVASCAEYSLVNPPAQDASTAVESSPSPVVLPATHPAVTASVSNPEADDLLEELRRIDWSMTLRHHSKCSWDQATGHLRCADNRELVLTTVRNNERPGGRTGIVFCRPAGGCEPCEARDYCFRSTRPHMPKHIELAVPTPAATRLRALLQARRKETPVRRGPRTGPLPVNRTFAIAPLATDTTALATATMPLVVLTALFLPAAARQLLHQAARGLAVFVEIALPPPPPPQPALLARSVADRQHRRMTWRENFERHLLADGAQVRVRITGGEALSGMLEVKDEMVAG